MSAPNTYYAHMWCGLEGTWTDETARGHADACQDGRDTKAVFEAGQHEVEHTAWCNNQIGRAHV